MKYKSTPTKPILKKRRRKRGRPAKYKNPVGRPKKFAEPIEFHVIFEKKVIDHLDALVVKMKERGVDASRSEVIRICVANALNMR